MIYLNPADRPPAEIHDLKMKLNQEFNDKAKINGLVSYIYYPTSYAIVGGHSEIELEGRAWTLVALGAADRSLAPMIRTQKKRGFFPFYRIYFSVTPNELKNLRESVSRTKGITCSHGALTALANQGIYSVPGLFNISPAMSFYYLAAAKSLGSKRIWKIDLHGNENEFLNVIKCTVGMYFETHIYFAYLAAAAVDAVSLYREVASK